MGLFGAIAQIWGADKGRKEAEKGFQAAREAIGTAEDRALTAQETGLKEAMTLLQPFIDSGKFGLEGLKKASLDLMGRASSLIEGGVDPISALERRKLGASLAARGITDSGAGIRAEAGQGAIESQRIEDLINRSININTGLFQTGAGIATTGAQFNVATGAGRAGTITGSGNTIAQLLNMSGQNRAQFYSGLGATVGREADTIEKEGRDKVQQLLSGTSTGGIA